MDWNVLILIASYVLAAFLIFFLVHLKRDPAGKRALTLQTFLGRLTLVFFVFYAFPFVVFITIGFFKVVVIGKYSLHQFKLHLFSVLIDQFNGYYTGAWNWIRQRVLAFLGIM